MEKVASEISTKGQEDFGLSKIRASVSPIPMNIMIFLIQIAIWGAIPYFQTYTSIPALLDQLDIVVNKFNITNTGSYNYAITYIYPTYKHKYQQVYVNYIWVEIEYFNEWIIENRLSQYVVPGPYDPHPNLTMAGPWTAKQRLLGVYHGPLEETQQKRFGGRTWIQNAFSEENRPFGTLT